ncbi:MAG TPA: DUF5667 domain-containing protein [Chloroflexota bacterium]
MSSSLNHQSALAAALERALDDRDSATRVLEGELADLVGLAETLEATACDVAPRPDFRAAARQRLLVQMTRSAPAAPRVRAMHGMAMDRLRLWAARLAAGLTALSFAGAAAASASATALPGDTLYPVKQASEAVALQLASTDSARQELLLRQVDMRLDETARLLEQGRDTDVALAAARYDETVARLDVADRSPASEAVQANLRVNEVRLSQLLQTAPASARHGLERALAATERGLGRTRPTAPLPNLGVAPVATATSEQLQPDEAEHRATANIESATAGDAGERAARESHDSAGLAPRGRGVEARAEANPVDPHAGTAEVEDSPPQAPDGEPRGVAVSESHAASRANPPAATSQPSQRVAPTKPQERPAPPRTEPGPGRGRN